MKHHNKLKPFERDRIASLLASGISLRKIAKRLKRSASTISEEIVRNGYVRSSDQVRTYEAIYAQGQSDCRKSAAGTREPLKHKRLYQYIISGLQQGWSPEQISGRLKIDYPDSFSMRVSHESIYSYVYDKSAIRYGLWEYLRRGQKKRKKQKGRRVHKSHIEGRVSISQRAERINTRKEFGHWEGDTVEGKRSSKDGVHTEVERVARYLIAVKVPAITSKETIHVQQQIFASLPEQARLSVTLDNGKENHLHLELTRALHMQTFFCHPYCSYEKGTNENTNGLLRGYFPKGFGFQTITQGELDEVVYELNTRPRKVLHFKTPLEVFTQQLSAVRIRT